MHTAHASPTHHVRIMRDILCLLCILVSAASFAGAQEGQELPPPGKTLKVTTEVVNVYAVVRQKNGRLIPDLTKDDFILEEDQQPQVIRYFSREADTPLTMGILVDTSPSQGRVLEVEKSEAEAFLQGSPATEGPHLRLALRCGGGTAPGLHRGPPSARQGHRRNGDQWRRGAHPGNFSHGRFGRGDAPLRCRLPVGARVAQERSGPQGSHPADGR